MFSVSSINSLLSRYLLGTEESSSTDLYNRLYGIGSDSNVADTVSISSEAQSRMSSLLSSLSDISDDSGNSLSDVLLSASNINLMRHGYGLVTMILSVNEADKPENTFSSITSSSIDDIDLISMSSSDLLSIIKKYQTLSNPSASTKLIDVTV